MDIALAQEAQFYRTRLLNISCFLAIHLTLV